MPGLVPGIHVLRPSSTDAEDVDGRENLGPRRASRFCPAMTTVYCQLSRKLPMYSSVSPLAPTDVPGMPDIAAGRLATAEVGIRYKGRPDVLLVTLDKGPAVAGVF